ncbi:MAG: CDP-alcohol phosphatidyltransferase family protein [Pseudomonadota bacterium]
MALTPLVEGGAQTALLALSVALIVLRLLCNLFDGMVAVEGGKAGPDGAFWNEVPDRLADIAILVGAGAAAGALALGWAAAALAVLVAYVRAVGETLGQPGDFSGPMAKPHRMGAICAGALTTSAIPGGVVGIDPLALALWAIVVGAALTFGRRAWRLQRALAKPSPE